jgi:hypothetical protein
MKKFSHMFIARNKVQYLLITWKIKLILKPPFKAFLSLERGNMLFERRHSASRSSHYYNSASGFGGLVVSMLAFGSLPAEAVGFFGRKNPQHAFIRTGIKAVCPKSQICGVSKNPIIYLGSRKL